MVLALRPDSRATSVNVTPMSGSDFAGAAGAGCGDWPKSGCVRASESTSEKVSTSAERQRERRNVRRDGGKGYPSARASAGSEAYSPAAQSGLQASRVAG